ncbi:MAG: elongation factor P maturation arginine rhamnosyltransferase EarP [Pseudomonadota bacterium]
MKETQVQQRWDIFCNIVDNFGDIGVCWRLARQLAAEHVLYVRLWVNDLDIAARLIPQVNASLPTTPIRVEGVELRHWSVALDANSIPGNADVVIEAFGCELPASYMQAMNPASVWINLEYLSAESWVDGFHGKCSVHPATGLKKYFFFPGFSAATGGLIRENALLAERDAFKDSPVALQQFWQVLYLTTIFDPAAIKLSLFCYPHAPIGDLFDSLAANAQVIHCLVPEGSLLPQIAEYFQAPPLKPGDTLSAGNLLVTIIPFLSQQQYDRLLWACDLNFVRGEDSWVRAIWAGRPFIWQPYRQDAGTHITKLLAFIDRYCEGLSPAAAQVWRKAHLAWAESINDENNSPDIFSEMMAALAELTPHSRRRSSDYSLQDDLATKLVDFITTHPIGS